ncbi:MAG: serine/threonine-protein phosphatase [Betaproteobacteria bacterium]|nr:serine/threonine-protein phosphatase [Betaproteobacteria bacterium]
MNSAICQFSRRGGRRINQDRCAYSVTEEALLMVLADGMGGHPRGEVAARIAVEVVTGSFSRDANPHIAEPARFLASTLALAGETIGRYAADKHLSEVPGTTCVACLIQGGTAWWAHAGDSRLYHLRDGEMLFRTRDHSLVWELVERGLVGEEEAELLPERSIIYNCLGASTRLEVESGGDVRLEEGDVVLLCSDGLWSPLKTPEIVSAFQELPLEAALRGLMEEAEYREGATSDNVTGLALRFGGGTSALKPGGDRVATVFVELKD